MDRTKTLIGKDVIESLTSGMYEDCKFIFREYIQNAVDQIDHATQQGVIQTRQDGSVWIEIDKKERKIIIEDNATGIKSNQCLDILRNIAQSTKRRGIDRGFRGIGRLGGLGYSEQLIFETSFKGENTKSTMIWDAKSLKKILNDRTQHEEASRVIDEVTDFDITEEEPEAHYFRVTLEGVTNESLLNKKEILRYLEMVAPVPFHSRFIFRDKISEIMNSNGFKVDEYKIYLNKDQIFKAYTTSIYDGNDGNKKRIDELFDINSFEIQGLNGELIGWCWYGLSTYNGIVPEVNSARGLRLRKDNIQVGSADTLTKLHKQKKNNFYFFGEVHALHPGLIPNSRRDYFVENDVLDQFENGITQRFDSELKHIFNTAAKIRSAQNKIFNFEIKKAEIDKLGKKGLTSKEDRNKLEHEIEQKKKSAEEGKLTLERIKTKFENEGDPVRKIYDRIIKTELNVPDNLVSVKTKINDIAFRTDKYSKLTKKERKLISSIFIIIDEVLNKELAENLKCKIDEKFQ